MTTSEGGASAVARPRQLVAIDGSNVAKTYLCGGAPSIRTLQLVKVALEKSGFESVTVVDASLRHQLPASEREEFETLCRSQQVVQAPRGVRADDVLLALSERISCPILSNDSFSDYTQRYPWVRDANRKIPYVIVGGEVLLFGPVVAT
jgi:Zc3h12a-like ribonuclease protein